MLNILCSYLQNDTDPLVKLCSLFDGIVEQHTIKMYMQSIEWNDTDGMSLECKLWILERINQFKRSIYSELVNTIGLGTDVKILFEVRFNRILRKSIQFNPMKMLIN